MFLNKMMKLLDKFINERILFALKEEKKILVNKYIINPLLPKGNYSYRIIKISFSKKEGIKKKNSCEFRVYESVDDECRVYESVDDERHVYESVDDESLS